MSEKFILNTLQTISQSNAPEITHTFNSGEQPLIKATGVPGSSGLQVIWLPAHSVKYFKGPESAAAAIAAYLNEAVSA
ncbi:hypothetical protein [Planococcus lenghuensis]|uniref:Uncharacterized protein n=1 Tax=Planococcus lenghuensis TaxID=2213202 RepID=A0A1Q2L4F2_9BACL|nr:hypothetical protein [Planococcus lenghuensis]AQQ54742.1 hypothetical protein B0X71_17625 [Planococcus lenghuensis]